MAGLSDILTAIQNGVTALNNLGSQVRGSLVNISGRLTAKVSVNGASVDGGGTNLTFIPPSPNRYRLYTPTAVSYNPNGLWAAQVAVGAAFIPPTGTSIIHLVSEIWATSGVAATGNFVTKWIKNATVDGGLFLTAGTDVKAGVGSLSDLGSGSAVMRADCYDIPSAGDYYNLFMFIDSTALGVATVTIDGNAAHSYTQATAFVSG